MPAESLQELFVEELRTIEQLALVPKTFKVPALYNMASSGKTPFLSTKEIADLGFKVVIYPNFIMRAQIYAAQQVLRELKATGSVANLSSHLTAWNERHDILGMSQIQELEKRYGVAEKARVGTKS